MDKNLAEEGDGKQHLVGNDATKFLSSPFSLNVIYVLGVLEEAEFYNIASLVRLVKERIRDNENRTSQVT